MPVNCGMNTKTMGAIVQKTSGRKGPESSRQKVIYEFHGWHSFYNKSKGHDWLERVFFCFKRRTAGTQACDASDRSWHYPAVNHVDNKAEGPSRPGPRRQAPPLWEHQAGPW